MKFKNKRKSFLYIISFLGLLIPLSIVPITTIDKNVEINQKQDIKQESVSIQNQNYTALNPEVERNGIKASFNLKNYTAKDFYEYNIPNLMDILKRWIWENIKSIVINYHELVYTSDILSVEVAPATLDTSLHVTLELDRVITATGLTIGKFSFNITELAAPQAITEIKTNINLDDILPIDDVSKNMYTIDIVNEIIGKNTRDEIITDINNYPVKYFLNYPKTSIELSSPKRPIVDPNTNPTFRYSSNGNSLEIDLKYLSRKDSHNVAAEYVNGTIEINGFYSEPTELVSNIQISANGELSKKIASDISIDDKDLEKLITSEEVLRTCFKNISETFISTNSKISSQNLEIVSVHPIDSLGLLIINVNVNDAKLNSGSQTAYGKLVNQRIVINNLTIPIETTIGNVVSVNNTNIEGLNSSSYSIDVFNDQVLKDRIKESILDVNNLDLWFTNPPPKDKIKNKPIIDPNTTLNFDYDSTSLSISGKFLSLQENINDDLVYKEMQISIINLNSVFTESISSISVSTNIISQKFSSDYNENSIELIEFLRNESTLKQIFINYPNIFIETNKTGLTINSVLSNKAAGTMTVSLIVQNAKLNTTTNKGYGSKNITLELTGFQKPINSSSLISNISINDLNISFLFNKYSSDFLNNIEYHDQFYNFIIQNYDKLIINPPSSYQIAGQPIFKRNSISFEYETNNYSQIKVSLQFLSSSENPNQQAIYKEGSFILSGFNINSTAINSNFSNGLTISGLDHLLPSQLNASSPEILIIKKVINDNFKEIFINYPEIFLDNINNFNISISNPNDANGTAEVNFELENAFENNKYVKKAFSLKISGFDNTSIATTTKNISAYEIGLLSAKNGITNLYDNLNTIYASDFANRCNVNLNYIEQLKTIINLNPSSFFENINTSNNTNPYIEENTTLEISFDDNDPLQVKVTGKFRQDKIVSGQSSPHYETMSFYILNFSASTTSVKIEDIDNIDFSSVLDKATTPTWRAFELLTTSLNDNFKQWIVDNISLIVSNYPDVFLSEISQSVQSMKLELKGQKISVTLPYLTIAENGILEPNREITFEIGGFSSNDKNTTLNLDSIDASRNSNQFNNIFRNISAFKVDWDNYIFTANSSYNGTQDFATVENTLLEYLNSSSGLNLFSNVPDSIDAPVSGVKISKNYDNYKAEIYYMGYQDGLIVNDLVKEIPIYLKTIPSSSTIFSTSSKFELGLKNYLSQKAQWPTTKSELIDYLREYTLTWVLNITANQPGLDIPIVYLDFNLIINSSLVSLDTNGDIKISSRALSIAPNTTKYPFSDLLDEKYIIYQVLSNSGITISQSTTLTTYEIKLNDYIQVLIYVSIAIFGIFIISFLIILIMKYFERKKTIYQDSDIDIF